MSELLRFTVSLRFCIKRGILNHSEAELSRIEIKKRLLESDSKTSKKLNYGKTNSNYLLMILYLISQIMVNMY